MGDVSSGETLEDEMREVFFGVGCGKEWINGADWADESFNVAGLSERVSQEILNRCAEVTSYDGGEKCKSHQSGQDSAMTLYIT